MSCTPLTLSSNTADALDSTIIVCSIAIVIHIIFWLEVLIFPALRQRNMIWLYDYILTDLLLVIRFFILYFFRRQELCLYPTFRTILCYFEATSKFYMNTVQSYLLLALNVSRYAQIVYSRNVYVGNLRTIIITHFLIGILPAINVIVQFMANWTTLWRKTGESCDVQTVSLSVQIFNIFVTYIIPVTLNVILLTICIRHVSSTVGIRNQQIIDRRRGHQRALLFQTIAFYSIWVALWSPYILAFQFININSNAGIYTSLLNYVEIAIDPAIVAILDVRFFKTWQTIWRKIRTFRHRVVTPVAIIAPNKNVT
ncbi:unnamed protein product [Adineta steineri]|uniref:G-protein coupled receptors family 1 profile domain-containing protein n=1 Tax=Adineta steineri TaxID=433720 RepID=A0A814MGW3_9BILA|nr:unnamed protein product [Adineta steineri]